MRCSPVGELNNVTMPIEYIEPENNTIVNYSINIDNNIIDKDIDDVDYSKYAEDDSNEDMAVKLGY